MKLRKFSRSALCLAVSTSMIAPLAAPVLAVSAAEQTILKESEAKATPRAYSGNLALHKPATASSQEASTVSADKVTDGYRITEGTTKHHWGSGTGSGPEWIYVDLETPQDIRKIDIYWESQKANNYKVQVASENPGEEASWSDVKVSDTWPASINESIVLDETVSARYVRVYIGSFERKDHGSNNVPDWPTISIYEIEVFADADAQNVALGRPAKADSQETDYLGPEKAFDGDKTSARSRWSSEVGNGPHWLYVDLGTDAEIESVNLQWETRKATDYSIQIAPAGANLADAASWTTAVHKTERPNELAEQIAFDQAVTGRYVRLWIESFDSQDPDSSINWNTISVYEMEVQGTLLGEPEEPETMQGLLDQITVDPVRAGDEKVSLHLPESQNFNVVYNGTDLEQIVGDDLTIHRPLIDKTVKLSFKATAKDGSEDYAFREISMTIPGLYQKEEQDNTAPVILPELQEWKGQEGQFVLSETSRVLYTEDAFADAASALAQDYQEMSGRTITVSKGNPSEAAAGDIVLSQADAGEGLGKEGYYGEIGDAIVIEAEQPTGAYWATRTILQALNSDEAKSTINKGLLRDYPLYETRSVMLDVGRKTFTIDFLKQMAKQMAWYKMNDFQIHLSDNYIWVEEYKTNGKDVFEDCYAGFRLESDIKAGGNGGLNKRDLTSKDVFYNKDEFRSFIKDARAMGVNIVPEFDVPAHSLAYTRVRPDLAMESGINRPYDHFDLAGKYDECVVFIKSVFDEYMKGEDPVFDEQTTVHIGSDEYEASQPAYRKFINEMLDHVQSTGRNARLWGSLSRLKNGEEVLGNGAEANIWNSGWASMDLMYRKGFKLININDGQYYVVPNATYYADYLNENTVYSAAINSYGGTTIPAGDKAMIGGGFAIWNDMSGDRENGMSEYDIYRRINGALPLYSAKAWGKQEADLTKAKAIIAMQGDAPGTNFGYEVEKKDGISLHLNTATLQDASGSGHTLKPEENASAQTVLGMDALRLNGNASWASIEGLQTAGLGNDLRVKVKRMDASNTEQILFESPYGSIKAVQKGTGKVGITRENHDYSFEYTLPAGQWVELEIKNEFELTHLYVDGVLVDTIGTHTRGQTKATCMLPVGTVGSRTNAFNGYVADIRLGSQADFASTIALDRAIEKGSAILAGQNVEGLFEALENAKSVTDQYNPTAEEITAALQQLDSAIKDVQIETADYSRVDLYLSLVPEDLSLFTEESRSALEIAINSIQRDLPKGMQADVDLMAQTLSGALSGLEEDLTNDGTIVPSDTITASADSQETSSADNKASNAIDNDRSTFWHSQWSNTTMPHWISLDLGESRSVIGITYVPRQSGTNGIATSYEIQVSDNGTNFTTVKTGTLAATAADKEIMLDEAVNTRHVRMVIIQASGGGFASAAEIIVHQSAPEPDRAGLLALINKAEALKPGAWSDESLQILQEAIDLAKSAAADENLTYQLVREAKASLSKAIAGLKAKDGTEEVKADKTLLSLAVAYAQSAADQGALEGVNGLVVREFNAALANAKAVLESTTADQNTVNQAWSRLSKAIHMLDFHTDFTELDALIARAQALNEADYTAESWTVLQTALEAAQAVRNDPAALNEQSIAAGVSSLSQALEGLSVLNPEEVDVTMLQLVVSQAQSLNLEDYIEAGQQAFIDSLAKAAELLSSYEQETAITQNQADNAALDLNEKMLALRLRPDEKLLEALRSFVSLAESLDYSQYSEKSAAAIREGAARIKANLARADYTEEQAREDLQHAESLQNLIDHPDGKAAQKPAEAVHSVKTSARTGLGTWAAAAGAAAVLAEWMRRRKGGKNK